MRSASAAAALVTAHPISVDPAEFEELARARLCSSWSATFFAARVDDPPCRQNRSVEERPAWAGGVSSPARAATVARPGRHARAARPVAQAIPEYVEERARIETAAAAVGGVPRRAPVAARGRLPHSVAAYKQFDVLLVNAVMDGLNLVAKEASPAMRRRGDRPLRQRRRGRGAGPLDRAGRPHDLDGHVRALEDALALPSSNAASASTGFERTCAATISPLGRGPAGRPRAREYDSRR